MSDLTRCVCAAASNLDIQMGLYMNGNALLFAAIKCEEVNETFMDIFLLKWKLFSKILSAESPLRLINSNRRETNELIFNFSESSFEQKKNHFLSDVEIDVKVVVPCDI